MSTRVATSLLRFEFVKGETTSGTPAPGFVACGDGTAFPMEVTLDQLAEIMYRVRDARWVSGTATQTLSYLNDDLAPEALIAVVTFTGYSPPSEKVELWSSESELDAAYTRRGYATVTNQDPPDIPMGDYGSNLFSDTQYIESQNPGGTSHLAYREAISERAMWANAFKDTQPKLVGHYNAGEILGYVASIYGLGSPPNDTFKTGFSFTGTSWMGSEVELPAIYAPFSTFEDTQGGGTIPYYGGAAFLTFSGQVAWIDSNNSGNPLDPLNKIYLGVAFNVRNSRGGDGDWTHATNKTDMEWAGSISEKLSDLKLKLHDGSFVTAAIYGSLFPWYSDGDDAIPTATDWIFEATEWWPYAKAGGPVWDSDTGAKL